jgi:hypothetical protein
MQQVKVPGRNKRLNFSPRSAGPLIPSTNPTRLGCIVVTCGHVTQHQLKAFFDAEFAVDVMKVKLDGSFADAKTVRDHPVR